MAFGALQHAPARTPALAGMNENVMGWAWSDVSGWISLNSDNVGACLSGSCGTYGVTVDPSSREIHGFAWSDVNGWICFGTTCGTAPECIGTPPAGTLIAKIENNGTGTAELRGWAKVCNLGDDGWIALNCKDDPNSSACATVAPYYRVVFKPSTSQFADVALPGTSFGWNSGTGGIGIGYIDFSRASLRKESPASCSGSCGVCSDGIDNDLSGQVDCADPSCAAASNCVENVSNNSCSDGTDNDFDGKIDCADPKCATAPNCVETAANNNCHDGIDNDFSGLADCQDVKCIATDPTCASVGWESNCALGSPDLCCSDGSDNSVPSDGKTDCADTSCQQLAPMCTPSWLLAKFGNVYAEQGITADTINGVTSKSKATYCLTSSGAITGVQSDNSCVESGSAQTIVLPKTETGYKGTLGSLDIKGILAGRYGKVIPFSSGALPSVLGGNVYYATGNIQISATQFQNGVGTVLGNGLLIVEGGNVTISGNLTYQSQALTQRLKNLASFGVIVKKNTSGQGGSIFIQPSVTQVVGAFFAEDTIHTGTSGSSDSSLTILGLMIAHKFDLQRNYHNQTTPAESFVLDGRASVNPPPGMQDITQSLPKTTDAF